MNIQDLINTQHLEGNRKKNNKIFDEKIVNMELTNLWYSNSEIEWEKALNRYWEFVKPENIGIEKKLENINPSVIKNLTVNNFYCFLHDEYFVWKYTAKNRLATTRKHLQRYKTEDRLSDLNIIKKNLFSFDITNIRQGLEIVTSIHGLGVAGASGLLALLYPKYFGTVDQFAVKALNTIKDLKEKQIILVMNPDNIKIVDGVKLIEIMKEKANTLNSKNKTDKWTPRMIDKVLWTFGR